MSTGEFPRALLAEMRERKGFSPVVRTVVLFAVLAIFFSSVWLLAVDSASRLVAEDWAEVHRADSTRWLTELALNDPRMELMAGEHCMVVAEDQQVCRQAFERALQGNNRLFGAQMALALIAENRKDLASADRMIERLRRHNKTFAARWLEWNYYLRNGQPDRIRQLTKEMLRHAPDTFRGDFSLLSLSGLPSDVIVETMLTSGSIERGLEYAAYLGDDGGSTEADLFVNLLGRVEREYAREAALRYIAERLRRRSGFGLAARVWSEATRCELIRDNRRSADQDSVLNPNPRLRSPFVPRSFDWSVAENDWATVVSVTGEGVRVEVRSDAPEGLPLLSKLILLPSGTTAVRVRMRTKEPGLSIPTGEASKQRIVWKLYDAVLDRVVGVSLPAEQPLGEDYRIFDLPIRDRENSGAVFVHLAVENSGGKSRGTWTFWVSEVDFEILS